MVVQYCQIRNLNGEHVCLVCALDDTSDALNRMHGLCRLICVQVEVGDARCRVEHTFEKKNGRIGY